MNERHTNRQPKESAERRVRNLIARQRAAQRPAATHDDRTQNPLRSSETALQGILVESWGWGYIS